MRKKDYRSDLSGCFAALVLGGLTAYGQAMPDRPARLTFDIISVSPTASSSPSMGIRREDPGIVVLSGMTLKGVMLLAYPKSDFQILNLPRWADSQRFDVAAKDTLTLEKNAAHLSPEEQTVLWNQNWERLRSLLEDRFKLKTHTEIRQMPIQSLSVIRTDKLKPISRDPRGGYYLQRGLARGPMKMSSLAAALKYEFNSPVIDQTALHGCFDLDLHWAPDLESKPDEESSAPSIATALREVGLKLVSQKGPVEVLVVDIVEMPSAN